MNIVIGFIIFLSAATGDTNATDSVIDKNGFDILSVIILAVIFIALITIFIYKKKNKK
ncbi:MAG: hypothetical protein ACYCWE_11275 [Eubacteriales bacterium]